MTRRKRILLTTGMVLLAALVTVGVVILAFLQRDVPELHASAPEHFKYGSIGADRLGIPYWIWRVLPDVFPEYLPDRPGEGYARMGFIYESPSHERPIGTSLRDRPIPRIALNCAVCHAGTVRESSDAEPVIYLGMPAHRFDLQDYARFLFGTAQDKRFNPDTIISAIKAVNPDFSWLDNILYRFLIIPQTRAGIRRQAEDFAWMDVRPDFGPGRVDTFNPYNQFFGFNPKDDNTVGTVDLPSLWNQRVRGDMRMQLHWDGNNISVEERNINAAIGAGAIAGMENAIDLDGIKRVADWILDLRQPEFPRDRIDEPRLESGRAIYQAYCAQCHAIDGHKIGQVVELSEIGTDPERLRSFSEKLEERLNQTKGNTWAFSHFRKTDGYANMPLDGIWLRGPYLHNGSVPTLRDLLKPPDERPAVFYRGYDVYDFNNVGFVSSGPEAEALGERFDTRERGNSNSGHEYGTMLSDQQKEDLLEYLKTE